MILDVVKALFYACSSYPKIASPHRLSSSDDYELCILSALTPAVALHDHVNKIVDEFRHGYRGVKDLEIGKTIAKGIALLLQDIGYRTSIPITVTAVIVIYIDTCFQTIAKDFHDALRKIYSAMHSTPSTEVAELAKLLRTAGGDFAKVIELNELSERRIIMEGVDLAHFFSILSQHIKAFEPLAHQQKALESLTIVEKAFKNLHDINAALSVTFLELAKSFLPGGIELSKAKLSDLLKLDIAFRKSGRDLSHLMPYIMFASLYIIKVLM
ncbi:MAG: hypothetical protein LM572_00075 [Ignisphaera sp.]|nr:hypothetical protein [Ignisphaera sp.]MCC6055944.1 hypothetical protein [Desulfurococcaceae archaeon]